MAYGGQGGSFLERLRFLQRDDLLSRVDNLQNTVNSQSARINQLQGTVVQQGRTITTLSNQLQEVRGGGFAPILYETEVGRVIADLVTKERFDAWASGELPRIIDDRLASFNLQGVIDDINAGIGTRIENALNTYTTYISDTPLFESGLPGSRLSLRSISEFADRFNRPFIGSTSPFRGLELLQRDRFTSLRDITGAMINRVRDIRQDFENLGDAFSYVRDAISWIRSRAPLWNDIGMVVETYRSALQTFRSGGPWSVSATAGIPSETRQFPPTSLQFNGVSPRFSEWIGDLDRMRIGFDGLRGDHSQFIGAGGANWMKW